MAERNLNTLLIFQKRGDGDDGFGNITPGTGPYVEIARRYGDVIALIGSEIEQGGQEIGSYTHRLKIRYDEVSATFDNSYRIIVTSRPTLPPMTIVGIADPDMSGRWLQISASRGVL